MKSLLAEKLAGKQIILASQSPRRQRLLKELELDFEVWPVDIEETYPEHLIKEEIPVYLAKLKANAFSFNSLSDDHLVITADTIVWMENSVLSKPKDKNDARRILKKLSGNKHEVYTGVCISSSDKKQSFYAVSEVFFRELKKQEIDYYIDNFEPFDKAGAYGIQEWIGYIGIEKITGSFYNVMGLPTQKLYDELLNF
ncbi:MAG: Maf family nucleotide pyrophosphatase [Bacteroidales bacterium]